MAANLRSATHLTLHRTIASIREARQALGPTKSIGFVPTMGALHEGHLSLFQAAREQNDTVVASIFVNPTQFAPGEDLDKYPRQLERDVDLLTELGVDHVFAPSDVSTIYGPNHVTYVDPEGFDDLAEGRSRPGHFRGVATIVTKLFNIVQPTRAYFGQKDAAQCVLIRRITQDLNMDLEIVVQPTVRDEKDGLALSSRNAYLTTEERRAAPVVYRSLLAAHNLWQQSASGSVTASALQSTVRQLLEAEPLVEEVQYVAVDSKETMQPLETVTKAEGAIVSLACKVGKVRLIDNIVL